MISLMLDHGIADIAKQRGPVSLAVFQIYTIILGSCTPIDSRYDLMYLTVNPVLSTFIPGFLRFIPIYVNASYVQSR